MVAQNCITGMCLRKYRYYVGVQKLLSVNKKCPNSLLCSLEKDHRCTGCPAQVTVFYSLTSTGIESSWLPCHFLSGARWTQWLNPSQQNFTNSSISILTYLVHFKWPTFTYLNKIFWQGINSGKSLSIKKAWIICSSENLKKTLSLGWFTAASEMPP